jgi:hypothetical protein
LDFRFACIAFALLLLAGCGKSSDEREKESAAALRQAIEASLAGERAKDQAMKESAAAEAAQHIEQATAEFEEERERQQPSREELQREEAMRRYGDRLRAFVNDPSSMQLRSAEFAPKKNGMCAEYNAKDRSGGFAGFKRVVVTETAVNPEEPPNRDTLASFLAFQVAARDTGCFPDVEKVHVLR